LIRPKKFPSFFNGLLTYSSSEPVNFFAFFKPTYGGEYGFFDPAGATGFMAPSSTGLAFSAEATGQTDGDPASDVIEASAGLAYDEIMKISAQRPASDSNTSAVSSANQQDIEGEGAESPKRPRPKGYNGVLEQGLGEDDTQEAVISAAGFGSHSGGMVLTLNHGKNPSPHPSLPTPLTPHPFTP
jgi:hypothetical protein